MNISATVLTGKCTNNHIKSVFGNPREQVKKF